MPLAFFSQMIFSIDLNIQFQFDADIAAAKKAFGFSDDCKVVSCYEAGRQGFWVHRCLIAMSIHNFIVEPTSMLVNRKARRAKTALAGLVPVGSGISVE